MFNFQNYLSLNKVSYDMQADALYLKINEGDCHVSEEINSNIIADLDKKGNLLGLEILNAKKQKNLIDLILFSNINLNKGVSYLQNILSKGLRKEHMISSH